MIAAQLTVGHMVIWLEGQRLKGGFSFIRTGGKNINWLLIKSNDGAMHEEKEITETEAVSVKIGFSFEAIYKNVECGR